MKAPQSHFISLNNPTAWRAALHGVPHAFGHTWESCYAMHLTSGLPTYLFLLETAAGKVVCPIAERTFAGHTDVVTPYGFAGFTGTGLVPEAQVHWKHSARARGYVCGYIGLNPWLPAAAYVENEPQHLSQMLYALDLRHPPDALLAAMSARRRAQLRQPTAGHITEDKATAGPFFLSHVREFLAGRGAAALYQFTPATLHYLLELDNVLVAAYAPKGEVQAVTVLAYTPYGAEYLFNVSVPAGQAYAAALLWHGALRLQALGVPWLNLGGGIREGDGVAEFKRRFGAELRPLPALKQVYAPAAYQQLCAQACVPAGSSGYFPAYRQSAPALPLD